MTVAARILSAITAPRPAAPVTSRRLLPLRAAFAADDFRVPFQEAIDYQRQKVRLPTRGWRDLDGRAHDRAFVVAGATKDALLADFAAAAEEVVAGNLPREQWRDRFEEIVARHGWTGWTGENSEAGRAWRANVIFQTNLRTAYAAGRYAQMTRPAMLKVRPYWQYRHGETRRPRTPRPLHLSWDGKIWLATDPVWQRIYPPNDWECSCGVRPLSKRDLARMGKDGPDEPPVLAMRQVRDPATGELVDVPEGVGFGWDHAPGADWAEGIVPREAQQPLDIPPPDASRSPVADAPAMPPARPFTAKTLPEGQSPETYAQAFLQKFGADIGQAVAWRDPAGHVLPVSDALFRDGKGNWKATKRGRGPMALRLAEALLDPDEIWINWGRDRKGAPYLLRSYLRRDGDENSGGGFVMFEWAARIWRGVTAFPPDRPGYLDNERRGVMLWRRPDKKQTK